MRKLQPKMEEIKEQHKDDPQAQQKATMELYQKEKINPLAGCLPILVQIPVFYALYKVLYVTIEMRHAPFFGWIRDLSAPDPTNIWNLFGLIPWDPSAAPLIGNLIGSHARRLHPGAQRAGDHLRLHHVAAAGDEPARARSGPAPDLHVHADRLHLHHGRLPGGPAGLLGVEQHPVDHPAVCDHAPLQGREPDRHLPRQAQEGNPA